MKKFAVVLLVLLAISLFAPAVFAADQPAASGGTNWIAIASGFSMAIASAGCGYAQGKASAAASEGFARNPGAAAAIRFGLILSLVLIESMALYTFAIVLFKVK
ncbi:MAG: ATP synthase F0 subunit C [Candidatus Acidiferrales bacterium]